MHALYRRVYTCPIDWILQLRKCPWSSDITPRQYTKPPDVFFRGNTPDDLRIMKHAITKNTARFLIPFLGFLPHTRQSQKPNDNAQRLPIDNISHTRQQLNKLPLSKKYTGSFSRGCFDIPRRSGCCHHPDSVLARSRRSACFARIPARTHCRSCPAR